MPSPYKKAPQSMTPQAKRTFQMKFDALCRAYGDPLAGLFALAASTNDPEIKLRCFAELLPYRYARLKQIELTGAGGIGGEGGRTNIFISTAPPAQLPAPGRNITPSPLHLVSGSPYPTPTQRPGDLTVDATGPGEPPTDPLT
jgi:hypothetical protein